MVKNENCMVRGVNSQSKGYNAINKPPITVFSFIQQTLLNMCARLFQITLEKKNKSQPLTVMI